MQNVLPETMLPSVFAALLVGIAWKLFRGWPRERLIKYLTDDDFLNVLTYDAYLPANAVRSKVSKQVGGGWIDPESVCAALEHLLDEGLIEMRLHRQFIGMRTRDVPEYRRISDFDLADFGIPPLSSSDLPRQWSPRT